MVEIRLNSFAINALMLVFAVEITVHLPVMIWRQFVGQNKGKSTEKNVRGDNRAFPFLIFNYLNENKN